MSHDYTKHNTILITPANVCYTSTGKVFKGLNFTRDFDKLPSDPVLKEKIWKGWKEKPIFILQRGGWYYTQGLDISVEHIGNQEFLNIHTYYAAGDSVKSFKDNPKLHETVREYQRLYEVRIFSDASIVRIYKVKFSDRQTPSYFIYNPHYQGTPDVYHYGSFCGLYNDAHNVELRTKKDANNNPQVIEVTEKDLQTNSYFYYADRNSAKHKILFADDYIATDLRRGVLTGMNQAARWEGISDLNFADETKQLIRDFFHLDNEYNTNAMKLLTQYKRSSHKNEIENMTDLITFTRGRLQFAGSYNDQKHEERIASYTERIKTLPFDTEHSRKAIWLKQGDEIICCVYHGLEDHDWYVAAGEKAALFYNVKTKKRVLAISDSHFNCVSLPIPSAKAIFKHLNTEPKEHSEYDYPSRTYTYSYSHEQYEPEYKQPFEEIFAGTNIAFLRQYADPSKLLFNPDCEEYASHIYIEKNNGGFKETGRRVKPDNYSTIGYQLDPKHLGIFALNVLIGSAEPWLEQSIKCKLFNLYLTALAYPDKFVEKKKYLKDQDSYHSRNNFRMVVSKKASNLKKAFSMTNEQIRLVDKAIGDMQHQLEEDAREKYIESHNEHISWNPEDSIPTLCGAEQDLGVELNKIDLETFKEILALSINQHHDWNLHTYKHICEEVLKNYTVKQRITFELENPHLSHYEDYLRMREQLQSIAETLKKPDIWDEKMYPVKPTGGSKFFRYRQGQRIGWRNINSPEDFLYYYQNQFNTDNSQLYYDDDHNFIGIMIVLDKDDILRYLHDDIQYWVTFYQDESKQDLFASAIRRVLPFEYRNEEFGLQIIAPKTVADLKKEGSTLSHCVASFVDPIINNTENVMLIRKIDRPADPYFTLALDNRGNIEQVHCYHNGALSAEAQKRAYDWSVTEGKDLTVYKEPADIVGFLQAWAKAMKGRINKATIRECYGALCANRR